MALILLSGSIGVMIFMEWTEIRPDKNKKHLLIFTGLLAIGITLWILRINHVDLVSPFQYFMEK